jgi:hypothetical protein
MPPNINTISCPCKESKTHNLLPGREVATSTILINYELPCWGSQHGCMVLKHHTRVERTPAELYRVQPTVVRTTIKIAKCRRYTESCREAERRTYARHVNNRGNEYWFNNTRTVGCEDRTENIASNSSCIVKSIFVAAGTGLLSRCPATIGRIHRQQSDPISLLLFFQNKESRLKIFLPAKSVQKSTNLTCY